MRKALLFIFACLLGFLAPRVALPAAEVYAVYRADLPEGTACRVDARWLRPTQFAVGFREVAAKTETIDGKKPEKLVVYLKKKDIPIVVGPGGAPYLTDGHHTLNGLLRSRHADKTAYGHVIANWSALAPEAFWARMKEHRYVYLHDAEGRAREPSELPARLGDMANDPWRGLAWAVQKAGGYEERPGVYFQEFGWADFFRERVRWDDRDDADFARAVREAVALARDPAAAALPGYAPVR